VKHGSCLKELGWLRLHVHCLPTAHKLLNASWSRCYLCRGNPSYLLTESDRIIDWLASKQTEEIISTKKLAEKYHNIQGTWYSKSRLEKEGAIENHDLDCSPFFDHQYIKKFLPIVSIKLDIFLAYLAFVHTVEFPHRGVESTLRSRVHQIFEMSSLMHFMLRGGM
jgi:hypothetical protein